MDFKYDRLTRELFFRIEEKEYSIRPTNRLLARIESACPSGETLVGMSINKKPATMAMMMEAFCSGLLFDGAPVKQETAGALMDKFVQENGVMPGLTSLYYALLAAANFLGTEGSKAILESMDVKVLDTEQEKKQM